MGMTEDETRVKYGESRDVPAQNKTARGTPAPLQLNLSAAQYLRTSGSS
jgi:hypothetical protein